MITSRQVARSGERRIQVDAVFDEGDRDVFFYIYVEGLDNYVWTTSRPLPRAIDERDFDPREFELDFSNVSIRDLERFQRHEY